MFVSYITVEYTYIHHTYLFQMNTTECRKQNIRKSLPQTDIKQNDGTAVVTLSVSKLICNFWVSYCTILYQKIRNILQ